MLYANPLALMWKAIVVGCFMMGYGLYLRNTAVRRWDARAGLTALIGSLLMIATYGHSLSTCVFKMTDCMHLAVVVGLGWTAEPLVGAFLKYVGAPDSQQLGGNNQVLTTPLKQGDGT